MEEIPNTPLLIGLFRCLSDFPRQREALTRYRDFIRTLVANGLTKWQRAGVVNELMNHKLFAEAIKNLTKYVENISEEEHKRWLDDSMFVCLFVGLQLAHSSSFF